MIIVTKEAYHKLSPMAKDELLRVVLGKPAQVGVLGAEYGFSEDSWEDVADLSPRQVAELIDDATSLYDGTRMALKMFAERGPILHSAVIKAECIDPSGEPYWDSLAKFQGGTTRRVRAVTGDKHATMLAWPDWEDGEGYYGITEETHRSLRVYFNLI